jgi:hypothetical protein
MDITVGKKAIAQASEKLKNWGRWGADDQIGTLNHIKPEDIVKAATLIRTGKVFALGIPLDRNGPQSGLFGGRWNPIHTMLATGTDAVAGRQDFVPNIRYADDAINMPVQCATHWDALGHISYEESMYNGHDARNVDCNGLGKLGIEHARDKMACCSTSRVSTRWTASRTATAFPMPSSTPAPRRRASRSAAAIS